MVSRQLDEEAIFHIARKLEDPADREKYLEQICAGDQALRERVEALVEVHEKEQDFLRSAQPSPTIEHAPITEGPGAQIGRYKLLQKIGEGGFGVVYMAEQQRPVRRKVALKIIKPGMDSHAVVARFEAERQALALMDHPQISRVLDGGATESGRPYFVMELVKGVPITEYCDANQLPTEERLKLFVVVCQAVQHAHQKGIIHRDLKPSNILVTLADGQPVVKVIDFGVAKALNQQLTERTLFTSFGQMIGTPQYMSPEQAEMSCLDVDTRSDVYSLGVLLYELLTGSTPHEPNRLRSAGYAEMQRIIREEEPPKPSTRLSSMSEKLTAVAKHRGVSLDRLHRAIRGDLDWIVMKALEKERSRRFETASSLAADVERYLKDEPIEARPPSHTYRFRKFVRRNKSVLVTSVIAIGTLIVALILLAHTNSRLHRTLFALQQELLARALSDAMAGDILLCDFSLERAVQAGAKPDTMPVIRALASLYGGQLDDAVSRLEQAQRDRPDDPTVLSALQWAYFQKGEVQSGTEVSDRLANLKSTRNSLAADHERLLFAYTKVYGPGDLTSVVAEVDDIISRNRRWGIAYAIRAEARTQRAKTTRSLSELRSAREDAELAVRYHPDNAFVLTGAMHAYLTSLELAKHLGTMPEREYTELTSRAAEIAALLENRPDYLFGVSMRVSFYRFMDYKEQFAADFQNLIELGSGGDQAKIASILADAEPRTRLLSVLAEHPRSFAAQTALMLVDVLEGETRASDALDKLKKQFINLNQRWLMLDIALAAHEPNLVRRLAKEFRKEASENLLATISREDMLVTKFYADDIGEAALLEECGPFLFENSVGHYAIGMWRLCCAESKAEVDEAKGHLQVAGSCPVPGPWHAEFARAYLKMIESGRLPSPRHRQ